MKGHSLDRRLVSNGGLVDLLLGLALLSDMYGLPAYLHFMFKSKFTGAESQHEEV